MCVCVSECVCEDYKAGIAWRFLDNAHHMLKDYKHPGTVSAQENISDREKKKGTRESLLWDHSKYTVKLNQIYSMRPFSSCAYDGGVELTFQSAKFE